MDNNKNSRLRERSGEIKINDKLTAFLYDLMRDHITPGKVEELVRASEDDNVDTIYSNGWLAQYANDLSNRLK